MTTCIVSGCSHSVCECLLAGCGCPVHIDSPNIILRINYDKKTLYGIEQAIDLINSQAKLTKLIMLQTLDADIVVLYRVSRKGRRFWIADPGKGKYKVSSEEMKRHWESSESDGEGIAMLFERGENFGKTTVDCQLAHKPFSFLMGT